MKNQETLEEFAERMAVKENKSSLFELAKKYIALGAKWQAEQDKNEYSEEDMINFAQWFSDYEVTKSELISFTKQRKNK